MKNKKILIFIVVGLVALFVLFILIAYAATSYRGYAGQMVVVNEFGTLKGVVNSGGSDIFIPTNSSNEWSTFIANKPSYISFATVPGAPGGLARSFSSQTILSWSAPSNGGSAITNYNIYRSTSSGAETYFTQVGNVLTYTNTSLTNGITYYYKVSAVNAIGEGALSGEFKGYPGAKRIFVTSTTYGGNLGGVAGADSKCQTRANAASLGGTWKALICTSTQNATAVPTYGTNSAFVRVDGYTVSANTSSPNDLFDGTIENSLNSNEFGVPINSTFGDEAWTGCWYLGVNNVSNPWHCDNWTTSSGTGPPYKNGYRTRDYGNYLNATDYSGYIGTSIGSCQNPQNLLCIES